jgi:hypothetical protein
MKGILKNTPAGWYVWYSVMRDEITSGYDSIPVYQETFDFNGKQPIIPLVEGKQVEFKIEDFWETGGDEGIKLAKLIIPKEEPKDVVLGYKTSLDAQMLDSKLPKQENCCTPEGQIKRYVDCIGCDRKPKQETDEDDNSDWSLEGAKKFALSKFKKENSPGVVTWKSVLDVLTVGVLTGHKFGAKWQQERMYSEEDLREAFKQSRQALIFEKDMPPVYESFEEWFKQHKKL